MIWLTYTLTPRGTVSAGKAREAGNDRPVHDVLPGSVVRGALAADWWIKPPGDQAAFDALFKSQMAVHAAIPGVNGTSAELNPLGWSREKYPADSAYELVRPMPTGTRVAGRGWAVPRSWTTTSTRVELVGGVAEDGKLYTRRASNRSVTYVGHLALDDATPQENIEWLIGNRDLSVGGQRSVMGRCEWRCKKAEDPFPVPEAETVALTALQPIILVDDYGANSLDLGAAILNALADIDPDAMIDDSAVRPVSVGGWHGRAGFPKPTEWALDAGSWVLVTSERATEAWARLRKGLGVRRAEGYGAIALTIPHERPRIVGQQPAAPTPDAVAEPTIEPAGTPPGDKTRLLIESVPDANRRQVVQTLLQLAREIGAYRGPVAGPRTSARLTQAAKEQWTTAVAPHVVNDLLTLLRTPAQRTATVHALEELR